jgi:hypothetical protein
MSPCTHIFHMTCVAALINCSPMFLCPSCKQIGDLTTSISSEALPIEPFIHVRTILDIPSCTPSDKEGQSEEKLSAI